MYRGNVEKLDAFKKGYVYVQDPAARLAVKAAGLERGMSVLDACSAPGGKSFAAASEMNGEGHIVACDIHKNKLVRIEKSAERLGVGIIETRTMDAREPDTDLIEAFDAVIADVPCSGLGVIRKKPDIRYKPEEELKGLPVIQSAILRSISKCVKPGGTLLYSTCTVLKLENEDVVRSFLKENPDFALESFELPFIGKTDGMVTLWPHIHGTDGFFICRMKRRI